MGTLGKHWKLSEESKKNHSIAAKNGRTGKYKRSDKEKERLRNQLKKVKETDKWRKAAKERMIGNKLALGRKRSEQHKKRIAEFMRVSRNQENNPNWKGGRKREHKILYGSRRYSEWRKLVFERDEYKCQNKKCGAKSGNGKKIYIEAHHIKEWSKYPELRFVVSNGITLCKKCHNKTKKGRKK